MTTTLKEYLNAINPEKFLTYDNYLRECVEQKMKPIKQNQWDVLISMLAGRKMQDTATQDQWLENLREE